MTLNDASDGLVAVINAIDPGIRFYPEAIENHPGTPAVTGEIAFRLSEQKGPFRNSHWDYEAIVTLTTRANQPGWAAAIRRIRDYLSPFGEKSIYQAVAEDTTLGGKVISCLPKSGGLIDEKRVQFPDGDRWTQDMTFQIRLGAQEV